MTGVVRRPGPVRLEVDGGLATITLSRPDKANAIDAEVAAGLVAAVSDCRGQQIVVRAILLRGDGDHFCAGGQVEDLLVEPTAAQAMVTTLTRDLNATVRMLVEATVPVVVAVRGFAVGGGLGLACAGDLVVAGTSARFLSGFSRIGLAPDCGVGYTLPRLIGQRAATDMVLTNKVVDADEAMRLGLVSRVVPDEELDSVAAQLARGLATGPSLAFAESKRMLRDDMSSLAAHLVDEAAVLRFLCLTSDAQRGIRAQFGAGTPLFRGE